MALRNRPQKMGGFRVEGVADAVDDKDAVNKSQLDAAVASLETAIDDAIAEIPNTITEAICGLIAVPTNKDYRVALNLPIACTILETTTRSASGTCTATFKINTTALGGTANSVSSTEQAQTHSSANAVAAGDDIVITISANASCTDLSFTIKTQRTIS
jgi:hypothetical protein